MTATISESGASYSAGNSRSYDAWGNVVVGGGPDDPKGRYCANLGHKQDDESGLVYMRARYEDPATGRFTSQDPEEQGSNWFGYANNSPTSNIDSSGAGTLEQGNTVFDILKLLCKELGVSPSPDLLKAATLVACLNLAATCFESAWGMAQAASAMWDTAALVFDLFPAGSGLLAAGAMFTGAVAAAEVVVGICALGQAMDALAIAEIDDTD